MQLKKIGTKNIPDWLFIIWFFQSLISKYNPFCIILNSNQKAVQTKKKKIESDFDFILKQILNLDIQKKISKSRFIKFISKPKEKKKSSSKPLDLCPYCIKPNHVEDKCYYKQQERASKNFWQKFQSWIKSFDLKSILLKPRIIIKTINKILKWAP